MSGSEQGARDRAASASASQGFAGVWPALLDLAGPAYVAAADGTIVESNAAFDDIIRPHCTESGCLPQGLCRRVTRSSRRVRQVEHVHDTDGTPRVFEGRHRAVAGGAYLVGVYQDITRAEDALARLRGVRAQAEELLSTVSDWVWQVDADWIFRESSARSERVLGFDPATMIGLDFFHAGEVVADPRTGEEPRLTRGRRAPFRDVIYRVPAPDGDGERLFQLTAIPIFTEEDGVFAGFRGSARDVTGEIAAQRATEAYRVDLENTLAELRQANAELDAALARARAADHAKNAFLAMVGHELRTPLNAVIGFAEMMENEVLGPLGNEQYRSYVADIVASSRHLLGVINDILDVAKLEMNEIKLQLDEVRVGKVVDTCLSFVREKAKKHGVALDTEIADGLPQLVADPQKLRQMLVNLLGNAVKFTPRGGRVTVEAYPAADGGHVIAVRDTGEGIPPEHVEQILEPFTQGDGSLARQHEGLGLGLPLTKRLVEAHGGLLDLRSTPGEGTRVALIFPPNVQEVARTG